ncbi:galectin-3b isoform X3 [Hippocampus comes]|uniref:galectin-3b isoform X3 n=1 Tax=Hippocampus comes TaxID=109280 RepID=UPI00094EC624|nr:PREDICTED: galectin-3-like isoform X3 [Hippocampus comes]
MDLSDALDDGSPSGAGTQSSGSMAWPQQPNRPGGPANPTWGGGPWPQNQPAAGGGGAGWWPGQQPAAGGGAAGVAGQWPGGQPAPAGGGAGWWPGQQPPADGGAGQWPGGQPPAAGGGQWPSPSKGSGDWPAPSPGTAANTSLTVPYNQKIPNGLRSGSVIHIKGSIKPKADKVTVDLSTDCDLAFHFNPRFNESGRKVIVRNSKIGGRWGSEERDLSRFPFTPGEPFELKIECTSSAFVVSVQGSHLLHFKHRGGNPGQIRSLDIYNDLSLSHVSIQ